MDSSGGLSRITRSLKVDRETEEKVREIWLQKKMVREMKICWL